MLEDSTRAELNKRHESLISFIKKRIDAVAQILKDLPGDKNFYDDMLPGVLIGWDIDVTQLTDYEMLKFLRELEHMANNARLVEQNLSMVRRSYVPMTWCSKCHDKILIIRNARCMICAECRTILME